MASHQCVMEAKPCLSGLSKVLLTSGTGRARRRQARHVGITALKSNTRFANLNAPPCLPQLFFTVTAHRSVALQSVYHASPPPRHPVRGCEDSPFTEEKLRLREATRRLQASRMAATSCKVVYVRTRCTTWTRNLSARDPFSTCCLSTFQPE